MTSIRRIFRGTAANAVADKETQIRQHGINPARKAGNRNKLLLPREKIVELLKTDLAVVTKAFGGQELITYGCADPRSAAFYAWRSAQQIEGAVPILIEFDADASELTVDGNDFLLTIFCRPRSPESRAAMIWAFGEAICPYLDISEDMNPTERLSIAEIALCDPDIIDAHYHNEAILQGKLDTMFRSAFKVKAPIDPSKIVSVKQLTHNETYTSADLVFSELYVR